MATSKFVFNYEDIFSEIPDDPDNILMTIPEEICKLMDVQPGDNINVSIDDGKLLLTKANG